MMSTGSIKAKQSGKHLKKDEELARQTYEAVGDIKPLGRYVVIKRCADINEDPGVKCIICFACGEMIRDLCAFAHFRSRDVFNLISFPWGPACALWSPIPPAWLKITICPGYI